MRNNSAMTLMELLIAITILAVIILSMGGIFLSGLRLSQDTQAMAQAQRNALLAMAHIKKQISQSAASDFFVTGQTLTFGVISPHQYDPSDPATNPNIVYTFSPDPQNTLSYTVGTGTPILIATHIAGCIFTVSPGNHNECMVTANITGTDNNETKNPDGSFKYTYTLSADIGAPYSSIPAVF